MHRNILNFSFIRKFGKDVSISIDFFGFFCIVSVDEFFDSHEAATYSYQNPISLLNFDKNSFLPKFVYAFRFTQKHDIKAFSLWIFINEAGHRLINFIIFMSDVYNLGVF